MKTIPIKNTEILGALNNFLWYYENKDIVSKTLKLAWKSRRSGTLCWGQISR